MHSWNNCYCADTTEGHQHSAQCCQLPQHQHDYSSCNFDSCTLDDNHTHTDDCYYCGQVGHSHADSNCELKCTIADPHECKLDINGDGSCHTAYCDKETHTAECFSCGSVEHTHSVTCYDPGQATCGQEHHPAHTQECYTLEDGHQEHKHEAGCYQTRICGLEEHTHGSGCLINTNGSNIELIKLLVGANIIGDGANEDIQKLWGITREQGIELQGIFNNCADDAERTEKLQEYCSSKGIDLTLAQVIQNADENFLLGIASRFCVFVEDYYQPSDSDAEGRVAVGGDFIVDANFAYQIGKGPYMTTDSLESKMNNIGFAYLILGGAVTKGGLGDERNDSGNIYKLGNEIGVLEEAARRFVLNHTTGEAVSTAGLIPLDRVYLAELFDFAAEYAKFEDTSKRISGNHTAGVSKNVTVELNKEIPYQVIPEVKDSNGVLTGYEVINKSYTDPEYKTLTLTYTGSANTSSDTIFFNLSEGDIDGLDEIHFIGVGDANVVINVPDGGTINFGDDGSTIVTKFGDSEISKKQDIVDKASFESMSLEEQTARRNEIAHNEHVSNNSEASERILYNFYNANEIILNRNLNGTLLAPNAHIDGGHIGYGTNLGVLEDGNGHLSGAMIAKSFHGALEIGFRPYAGNASIAVTRNVTVRKNWANVEPQPIEVTLYQSLGEQYNVTADTVETLLTEGKITKVSESDNIVNPVTIQADSGENGWENTWYNLPQFQTMDDGQTQTPYYYYAIETPIENADWEVDYQNNGISNGVIDVTNHKNISVKVQKEYLNWDGTPIDLKDINPKPVVQFKLYASTEPHTHVQPNLRNLICAETHTHTPKCYAAHLVCTETSMAHKHKPSCYACHYECEWFEHTHSEECGDTCTIREHTHNEACISCSYLPAEDSLKPVNNESGNNIYTIEYDASGELPLDPEETPILGPNQSLTGGGSSKTAMMTELENLPAIDEKGNKLYYYIEELNADGYDVTYTGNAWNENRDVTITNKQKSIEITVEKNWVGVSPSDRNPVQIQIEQYIQSEDGNITEDLDMPLMFNILADKEYLTVGSTAQIIPVNTKGKDVTYESTNEAVATVDENGVITGVSNGKTTIIANCDGQFASLKMEVAVLYPKDVLSNVVTLDSSKVLDSFTLKFTDVMLDKLKQMWENDPDSDNDGRGQYFQNTPIVLNLNGSEVKFGLKYKDSQWYFNMWYSNINGKIYDDATVDHLIENGNLVIDQTFLPNDFKCGNVQITSNLVDLIAYPEWTYASEQSALQKTMSRAAMYRSLLRNITSEDVKLKIKNVNFATLSLGPGNNWTQTLEVPVADFYGNPYYYSAKETSVPDGFVVKYYFEDDDDKFQTFISAVNPGKAEITVTNSKKGSFPVEKKWGDSEDHTNDKVRINLYKAGTADSTDENLKYVKQLELSIRNSWNSQFDDLPATEKDGSVIYYYIREIEISLDGGEFVPVENTEYHPEYNINGLPLSGISADAVFTVTNNRTYPEKPLSLTVNKVWHGQASDSIRFTLKQYRKALNEESYSPVEEYSSQTYELSAANDWTITIDDLVGQSTDGAVYKYEVVEEAISGYRTAYTQGAPNYDDWTQSATITNTKYFNLKVLKKWIDRTNNGHNGDSVFFKIFRSVTKPDRDDVNLYEALTITPDAPINMIWGENSILYVNKQVSVKGEYDTDVIDVNISETPNENGRYSVQVFGKKAGETQLTLTDGLLERTVSVTIENPEMVIVLPEGEDASIQSHDELQLRVEDVSGNELRDIRFTSSDTKIVTVDADGKVTGGTTSGTATITAKKEGYKDATIAISVGLRSMTVKDSKGNTGEMTLTTGDTETLAAYFGSEELDGVTFTSSESTVVSVDGNTITAGVPGTATITATKPGYAPVTIQVTVQEIPFVIIRTDTGETVPAGSTVEVMQGQEITFTSSRKISSARCHWTELMQCTELTENSATFVASTYHTGNNTMEFVDANNENNKYLFSINVVTRPLKFTYNNTDYWTNSETVVEIPLNQEVVFEFADDIRNPNVSDGQIVEVSQDNRRLKVKGKSVNGTATIQLNDQKHAIKIKVVESSSGGEEPETPSDMTLTYNGTTYQKDNQNNPIVITQGQTIYLNASTNISNDNGVRTDSGNISVQRNSDTQIQVIGNSSTNGGTVSFTVKSQNNNEYTYYVKVEPENFKLSMDDGTEYTPGSTITINKDQTIYLNASPGISTVNENVNEITVQKEHDTRMWIKGESSTGDNTVSFTVKSQNNNEYTYYIKVVDNTPETENFYFTVNGTNYYPNGEAITVTAGSSITLNSNIGFYNPQVLNDANDKISVSSNGNQLTVSGNAATDGDEQFQVTSQNSNTSYVFNVKVESASSGGGGESGENEVLVNKVLDSGGAGFKFDVDPSKQVSTVVVTLTGTQGNKNNIRVVMSNGKEFWINNVQYSSGTATFTIPPYESIPSGIDSMTIYNNDGGSFTIVSYKINYASTSYSLRSMSSLVRSMRSSTPVESSVVFTDPVNGIAASNVIKLSAANDWAFDATNLPATDASGNKYYYWVVEYADEACTTEQIRGYTTNYIFQDGDASDAVIDTENLGSDPTVILCNVEKEQTAEMPSTGGRGTAANTFAGMAIMAGSAAGYFVLKRRRHRRSA
ncbi:MAG: choice-of-anchor A family protein [Oscillospiraceae bacterium]|nr:choice-of-anchor A family protein [Oscillospiraceae bacterium]